MDNNLEKKDSKHLDNKINNSFNSQKYNKKKDKYRILMKRKDVYDSLDDEEYKDEEIDYYISPYSWYIKIFDLLLFLSSIIYFIFIPYFLSTNFFISKDVQFWKTLYTIIDIFYIIDIIINFFRAYEDFDEHLVRKTKKILFHYLKTWFFLDLLQAVPYFSIINFLEKYLNNNDSIFNCTNHLINHKLYVILLIKIIKLYKMFNKNTTISYISEILSRNELFDDHGGFFIAFIITVLVLNMTTCLFIFIGINSYPGWIVSLNIQDESYFYIYLTSIYFVIVTVTTVGYGDITGKTVPELLFQIYLLIIGTIAYSFTISYISNNIIKANARSMTFEKNLELLQEIKIHHPNMKNSLYNEVLRNIYNEQLYERKDKHLLFDCLPYSLKNKLIMEMYRPLIRNFVFFKDIDNSDFIVKVATSLKPLLTIKNDILIQEGDYIKEIIFVKKGIVGLNISIDLGDPESSLKKFFFNKKIGKFDISYRTSDIQSKKKSIIDKNIHSFFRSDMGSVLFEENIEHIKIIEIRNNEHFGDALMFLNERCPLIAKVRTKTAEILILRKIEAIEIYSIYPNIWKRINKKSLYNMHQIYLKIKKIVMELSNRYKINIDDIIGKKKYRGSLRRNMAIARYDENEPPNESKGQSPPKEVSIKDKEISEHKQKIEELNETLNANYCLNIMGNASIHMLEDMTFCKKSSTQKESILSFEPFKINEKNLLFNNTNISINHSNNNSKINTNENYNKSKTIKKDGINSFLTKSKSFLKQNTIRSDQTRGRESMDTTKFFNNRQSIVSPVNYYNNTIKEINDTNNSALSNKKFHSSERKNEKIFYNIFTNLKTTKEKSFHLEPSYDNINKISNFKYIKNMNLQTKIKQILIKECINVNSLKKKSSFLVPPCNLSYTCKSSKNAKRNLSSKFNNVLSEAEMNNFEICNSDNSNKSGNKNNYYFGLTKSMTIKEKGDDKRYNNKIQMRSSSKLIDMNSKKRIFQKHKPLHVSPRKGRKNTKKKPEKINKQLNIISKNIESSSKNINNPEEFYMNFFTNIIAKESRRFNEDENSDSNNKRIIDNSMELNNVNTNRKSSNPINVFDSFFSNKDSNVKDSNLNLIRIKQKSGFNSKVE